MGDKGWDPQHKLGTVGLSLEFSTVERVILMTGAREAAAAAIDALVKLSFRSAEDSSPVDAARHAPVMYCMGTFCPSTEAVSTSSNCSQLLEAVSFSHLKSLNPSVATGRPRMSYSWLLALSCLI